uniref:Fizzy-related protein homolog n=1 Tax=Aquarana catesbeiana TaxID=8400 RepID=C1C4P7_AQUCT|nr:Fizzy-related protein homolog [Aquarana catesbeiana]
MRRTLTPSNSPMSSPSKHGDRFIPSRAGANWSINFHRINVSDLTLRYMYTQSLTFYKCFNILKQNFTTYEHYKPKILVNSFLIFKPNSSVSRFILLRNHVEKHPTSISVHSHLE